MFRGAVVLGLLLVPAACGHDEPERVAAPPADAAIAAPAPTPKPAAAPPATTPMPRPARGRLAEAMTLNAKCVACHRREAAEWQGSRHARAYTNAAFRAGFALESKGYCRECHAPEADVVDHESAVATELGVACVTCHVTEPGVVLTGPEPADAKSSRAAEAAHRLRRSAEFADAGGCAGCHEFRFPGQWSEDDESFMQTTVREHARTSAAAMGCPSCHMPLAGARRSHAFSQVRNAAWLRQHLLVKAERSAAGVVVTLSQRRAGHALPTGDLFRRLAVGAEARDARGKVLARATDYLARHFGTRYGRWETRLVEDDRVFEEPRVVELALPGAEKAARVHFWVKLERVLMAGSRENREGSQIESEVEIHSGVIP